MGKLQSLQQMMLDQLDIKMQKKKKNQVIENIRENFLDLRFSKEFLDITSKA